MKFIDAAALGTLKELLGEDLFEITGLYAASLAHDVQKLQECFAGGDLAALSRLAHALKGGSSNLGAMEVARLASGIERSAAGGDAAAVSALMQELPAAVEPTLAELRDNGFLPAD